MHLEKAKQLHETLMQAILDSISCLDVFLFLDYVQEQADELKGELEPEGEDEDVPS